VGKGFTDKHRRFVAEYLKDSNATQAALRAGYPAKSARQQGSRLLSNAAIRAAIGSKAERVAEKAEVTAEWVLGIAREVGDNRDAKDADRLKAAELGGRYLKLFTDKVEHSGAVRVAFHIGPAVKK
jgi:phage terminase small subunit